MLRDRHVLFTQYQYHSFFVAVIMMDTDGVTEAMNPKKEAFSEERLLFEVERLRGSSAEDIINNLLVCIAQHAESEPQSDDIALMVLRYQGER